MRSLFLIVAILMLTGSLRGSEVLDRVVVTVNGNALLQSDWDGEVRYEAFMAARPVEGFTAQERESALNRIIDQELLREQMRGGDFKPATDAEVDEQIKLLQAQYTREHPGQLWSTVLMRYGFSESEIRDRIELELNQLRLVNERLQPSVEVDPAEVESYYKVKIASQKSGTGPISFDEAKAKIHELLVQQKINQLLDSWLESLRTQAKIQRISRAEAPVEGK